MHENIVRLKAVAQCLAGLEQPFVFVGGAAVSLYASNPQTTGIRPTDDVDVVIELATYSDHFQLEKKLRRLGFENDTESGVICRYKINGIVVDIMPTESNVLGFSNRWYPEGFINAIQVKLDPDTSVSIFPLPYFLASKWEAHKSRGDKDLRISRDFEEALYAHMDPARYGANAGVMIERIREAIKMNY